MIAVPTLIRSSRYWMSRILQLPKQKSRYEGQRGTSVGVELVRRWRAEAMWWRRTLIALLLIGALVFILVCWLIALPRIQIVVGEGLEVIRCLEVTLLHTPWKR